MGDTKVIENAELKLLDNGTYGDYLRLLKGNSNHPIRYSIGIASHAEDNHALDQFLFVGGLAVIGNLVNVKGENVISHWRGTHDIDLIERKQDYTYIVKDVFDLLDVFSKSLNISDKYTLRGKSWDIEGKDLDSMAIDLYFPSKKDNLVNLEDHSFTEDYWDRKVKTNFFGQEMNVLSATDLIKMKSKIVCKNGGGPRERDKQDLYHLVGVSKEMGYSPLELKFECGDIFCGYNKMIESMKPFKKLINVPNKYFKELAK
jgi:hypothetical protein